MKRNRHDTLFARKTLLVALFCLAVAASAYRFYLLRHVLDFTDENDHTTIGWLLTQGETLYGSLFSHHGPLPYIAAHIVALISPTTHPAHFRAIPCLAYLLVAALIVWSPLGRLNHGGGLLAGSAFLVLGSLIFPLLWGHLLLMEVFVGCGLAVFLAFVLLPGILRVSTRPMDDLIGGVAAGLALAASPLALWPLGVGILAVVSAGLGDATARRSLRLALTRLAAGAAFSLILVAIWLAFFGSFRGFVRDVFVFNKFAYAPFTNAFGDSSVTRMTWRGIVEWTQLLDPRKDVLPAGSRGMMFAFLLLVLGAVLSAIRLARNGRNLGLRDRGGPNPLLASAGLVLFLAVSRLRGFDFRALPFFILGLTAAVLTGGLILATGRRIRDAALFAVLTGPILVLAIRDPLNRVDVDRPALWPPELPSIAEHIRRNSRPEERIAAFAACPRLYLEARRRPATGSLFFLPWQAHWEELHPAEPTTCQQLQAAAPRFVFLSPDRIWGLFPWEGYSGCIDRLVKENYRKLPDERFGGLLWERADSGSGNGASRRASDPQARQTGHEDQQVAGNR